MSYLAGTFAVQARFFGVLWCLYYLKRFPLETLWLTTEPIYSLPLLDYATLEAIAAFGIGSAITISLKYSLASGIFIPVETVMGFGITVVVFEFFRYWLKLEKKRPAAVGQS